MNGIRFVELSASITGVALQSLGTDKFGKDQALLGLFPVSGGTMEFADVITETWGNRLVRIPNYVNNAGAGGAGMWAPPIYPRILANSTTTFRSRQTAVGAESQALIAKLMIAVNAGNFPSQIARHMGELHTQFGEGVATATNFPAVASATQDILNEVPDDMWMPLMAASIGDTPGQVKYSHPFDEGFPPFSTNAVAVGAGLETFQPIPTTNPLRGADTMSFFAKDDAGAAFDAFLYTGRIAGGRTVLSNRSPYGL